jgi:peptide/nickel transport system permease protein
MSDRAQGTGEHFFTWLRRVSGSLVRARTPLLGLLVLVAAVLLALFAPAVAPHDPNTQELELRLKPPFWVEGAARTYPLGTDQLGRDILSRLVYGTRISMLVGIVTASLSGLLGLLLGMLAGFYGRWVDGVISRVLDVQLAFPFVLLALSIVAILGGGLLNVILVLGIGGWMGFARIVRADTQALRGREFVLAARCIGVSDWRIMTRHILPNVLAPVIVIASFAVSTNIIYEAALTFLGVGVSPKIPTWGSMLADGRDYLSVGWWITTWPGLAIMVCVLGINLFGDWLRDVLDPRYGLER